MKTCARKKCGRELTGTVLAVQKVKQQVESTRMKAAGKKVYYCSMVCGVMALNEEPPPKHFLGVKEFPE